jgi:hypothetical protein
MSKKSIFKKIVEAKANGTGRPFESGKYRLTLQKLFIHEGFKGSTFIAELLVRGSQATGEVNRHSGKPEIPVPAGTIGSFAVGLDNPNAKGAQFSNVKRFLLALLGENEDEVTNEKFLEMLEELCGDEGEKAQPLKGAYIDLETFKKPKQSNQNEDFTHHRWTHVPMDEAALSASRAALEKAASAE